jgi:2-polyprenyl-3-methyl-5-hydroxy-6-metoxy-1,4-benzoquinol methylase
MSMEACRFCCSLDKEVLFDLHKRPEGETRFPSIEQQAYRRQVQRCRVCHHCTSSCSMDTSGMYSREYVNATYLDTDGLHKNFERIINLPSSKSDNTARVDRVCSFAKTFFGDNRARALLDIGSGLAVFPFAMKEQGWDCTALDPDSRAATHASTVAGVKAVCADFLTDDLNQKFPAITLNKVLEHVSDPLLMAARTRALLDSPGFLYIEVPDAETAANGGPQREEFFIEHLHIFSAASLCLLAVKSGFRIVKLERLKEPSSKFTIAAFLVSVTPENE